MRHAGWKDTCLGDRHFMSKIMFVLDAFLYTYMTGIPGMMCGYTMRKIWWNVSTLGS
jgi:hypothetical protein